MGLRKVKLNFSLFLFLYFLPFQASLQLDNSYPRLLWCYATLLIWGVMKTYCLGFFPGSRNKSRAVRWVWDWSVDKWVWSLSWRQEFKAKKEEKKVTDGDSGGWAFTSIAFRKKITFLQTALYVPNTSPMLLQKHWNQRSSGWLSPDNSRLQLTRSLSDAPNIHSLTQIPHTLFPEPLSNVPKRTVNLTGMFRFGINTSSRFKAVSTL